MEPSFNGLALLSVWNVSLLFALSLVLVVVVVWFTSKSYSCTDSMRLHFHSRSIGAEEGEPAATRLLDSNHLCTLSVIIPAFKEATRVPQSLKGTLLAAVGHLEQYRRTNAPFSWEIIVVDDGSPDGTAASVIQWTNHLSCADRVRVVSLPSNMGKGAAVKAGMLRARGEFLLMADADGAAPISEWVKLRALADQNQVVIGRRKSTQRKFSRLILSLGFRMLIRIVCGIPFPDTQCGFKLFTRSSASVLFSNTHIKRFAFDVEVLFLAVKANFKCADQEIEWTEVGGSTISSFTMFQMLKDILLMRCAYAFGFWTRQAARPTNANKND